MTWLAVPEVRQGGVADAVEARSGGVERAEDVVEGSVLQHDHDDVLDVLQTLGVTPLSR